MAEFPLEITYSQVAIFDPGLEQPFNNWTEEHFNQGFVWRMRSVSFRTPLRAGIAQVCVQTVDPPPPGQQFELKPDTVIAISVPFEVVDGSVEIASVFKGEISEVENGKFELIFEAGLAKPKPWCRFTFIRRPIDKAQILRGAEHLKPPPELIMTAEPA